MAQGSQCRFLDDVPTKWTSSESDVARSQNGAFSGLENVFFGDREEGRNGLTVSKVGFRDKKDKPASTEVETTRVSFEQAKIFADKRTQILSEPTCACWKLASDGDDGQSDCSCALNPAPTTQTSNNSWVKQSIILAKCAKEEEHTSATKKIACRIVALTGDKYEWKPGGKKVLLSNVETTGMWYWKISGTQSGRSFFVFGCKEIKSGEELWRYATVKNEHISFEKGTSPFDLEIDEKSLRKYPHLFGLKNSLKTGKPGILYPAWDENLAVTHVKKSLRLREEDEFVDRWEIKD